jgi:hypothetical protein
MHTIPTGHQVVPTIISPLMLICQRPFGWMTLQRFHATWLMSLLQSISLVPLMMIPSMDIHIEVIIEQVYNPCLISSITIDLEVAYFAE